MMDVVARHFERRARFAWWPGAIAAGTATLFLLFLNGRHRYEGVGVDDSPFADAWQACERIEYGWPFSYLAVPVTHCPMLPQVSALGLLVDVATLIATAALALHLFGRFQRRTFREE